MALNQGFVTSSDHPQTIHVNLPDNLFRLRVKENVDTLWQRLLNPPIPTPSAAQVAAQQAQISPAPGPSPSPGSGNVRHFASLIDFQYDFYDLTWNAARNVVNIVYKLGGSGGAIVSIITITYNTNKQPILITATHTPKTLAFTYDSDDYLDTMTRT